MMRHAWGFGSACVLCMMASGALAQPQQVFTDGCYPACREGFVCNPNTAQCVSACNPACAAGQTCTAEGRCVAESAAPPPPPGPPPPAQPAQPVGTIEAAPGYGTPTAAPPVQYEHTPVSFLLRVGPTFGWFSGGSLSLGVSIRLAPFMLLDLEIRGAGGSAGTNTYALGVGEACVRFAPPRRITYSLRGGVGAGFLSEFEEYTGSGYDYAYRVGYFRFAGGVLFMTAGRTSYGVEGSVALGSASQVENYVDLEDYGGFYSEFQILGTFNF